jgi:ACR3 family arsenite efflux pump ArsB
MGPAAAVRRSFDLTKGFAGRAFMIYLLYFALAFAVGAALEFPFGILIIMNAKQPAMLTVWLGLMQVANFFVLVLVAPIGTLSISLYYYDLRVRKEAFDLQMMMKAIAGPQPAPLAGSAAGMFGPDAS